MIDKAYIVTDLGPGDGGKGGTVHAIACASDTRYIIKEGGAQGCHGVCTSRGESFGFSQWGCGTFEGIKTHLSQRFVALPEALLNEASELRYRFGIDNIFDLLTIDSRVLCATPYHGIASRLKEMARGKKPRGTIGTGVGEAYRYNERLPELSIYASDLSWCDLRNRLAAIREQIRQDLAAIIAGEFLPEDREEAAKEIDLLNDDEFLDYNLAKFEEVARLATIVDDDYLGEKILTQDGSVIIEKSHGVITDPYRGFHPHTNAMRIVPEFTQAMLRAAGYKGKIVNIGVTRAYGIRHGAGPMPTDDPAMAQNLLPGSHKLENRYQGEVRVGPLDLVLLRYAIEACGGPTAFDGLSITWFDQIQANGQWHVCNHYENATDPEFFSPTGEIKVRRVDDIKQLIRQNSLGQQLLNCVPEITTYAVPTAGREELYPFCAKVLQDGLGVPVRLVSFGPTERDKVFK